MAETNSSNFNSSVMFSGGGPVSSAISGAFGLAGTYLQYKYNKRLAEQQNQYNIDMWKMQNEYNTPAAQMRRFQEAGLNPYLVASQGNAGNAMHAPEQVTPPAPEFSKHLAKIADIFNVEALRTQIAERQIKQAEARAAQNNVKVQEAEIAGKEALYRNFVYDIATGRYVPVNSNLKQWQGFDNPLAASFAFGELANNYKGAYLLPIRGQLMSSQRAYLTPQIHMANYEASKYPITYWVGTIGKGAKAISDITGIFNPSRYFMPIGKQTRGFLTPTGRVLNY